MAHPQVSVIALRWNLSLQPPPGAAVDERSKGTGAPIGSAKTFSGSVSVESSGGGYTGSGYAHASQALSAAGDGLNVSATTSEQVLSPADNVAPPEGILAQGALGRNHTPAFILCPLSQGGVVRGASAPACPEVPQVLRARDSWACGNALALTQ